MESTRGSTDREQARQAERILGQLVHPVSKAEAVRTVVDRALAGGSGAYVCLTNVHTTVESTRSPALRSAVDNSYLSVPDGMPLAWILRRRGYHGTEKVTGIEYIPQLASAGLQHDVRHYFWGGRPGIAARAAGRLQELVPGVRVVGASSPPIGDIGDRTLNDLKDELGRGDPHILWVGLGAPKQELWMADVAGELDVPVMIGVGAAFDYLAGAKPSAPTFLRHVGFEWLFRLAVEPRRLWRRYLVGNTTFAYLLARELLSHRPDGRRAKP